MESENGAILRRNTSTCVGIQEITFSEGDFRESPRYNFVFFRDGKLYYESMGVESAEILMALLGIDKGKLND